MNRNRNERGSATLELVIVVPAFLLIISTVLMAGRVMLAHQAMQAVANDAARAASIAKTSGTAQSDAALAAKLSLDTNRLKCVTTTVSVDTSEFSKPAGSAASVTATVTCVLGLADISLPGIPGSLTISKVGLSPIDTFRERQR